MKAATTALIRHSRMLKAEGDLVFIRGRTELDRVLNGAAPPQTEVDALKSGLHTLVFHPSAAERMQATRDLNQRLEGLCQPITTGIVNLTVTGGPLWLTPQKIDAWLGTTHGEIAIDADEATAWVHHLDGFLIGGRPISARVGLAKGHRLPPLARKHRGRARQIGQGCWLPFNDEQGRLSASPRPIAIKHGEMLAAQEHIVFDPCCGLGADAIGAALVGATVLAGDICATRIALARKNAAHFGVSDAIHFEVGPAAETLQRWSKSHPVHSLFLDPPWGGKEWDRQHMNYSALMEPLGDLCPFIAAAKSVVIKLPRTFDTLTLPLHTWEFSLAIASLDDHIADRVRMITALSSDK
jgi:hypothetical protein